MEPFDVIVFRLDVLGLATLHEEVLIEKGSCARRSCWCEGLGSWASGSQCPRSLGATRRDEILALPQNSRSLLGGADLGADALVEEVGRVVEEVRVEEGGR